ncbi:hypothetical protein B9Z55_007472 [Caenorhabditis nigoni]|uniref:Serpentine receptor class gamma n=1 Tax=Caenorhabditis nigoni TaxID=1611254 RepID=A0A2G5V9Z0_9PELO|nr:hypothetical protein B9Z55_007472 [Caenorhabditis nigoni]
MVFVLNITNDDDPVVFDCDDSYDSWIEISKYVIQFMYLVPGGILNSLFFYTIWFGHRSTYSNSSFFVIYSIDCFVSVLIIICDIIGRFIMYIPPLCPILSPYFYNPLYFFKGVMIVMNHSKTCKFIIQSLLVLNRMTSVIWPLEYSKMWRKCVKWAVALIILLPLATDWNLVISRVYMEPMFGGFYFFYTRKVAWAKQSRFQVFFISIAFGFTVVCTSYTLHALKKLKNRITKAERTVSIASAYISIGYIVLSVFQVFYAFFPYLPGGVMVSLAHVAYDVLDVGSPFTMIAVNKTLRHHVFGMTVKN